MKIGHQALRLRRETPKRRQALKSASIMHCTLDGQHPRLCSSPPSRGAARLLPLAARCKAPLRPGAVTCQLTLGTQPDGCLLAFPLAFCFVVRASLGWDCLPASELLRKGTQLRDQYAGTADPPNTQSNRIAPRGARLPLGPRDCFATIGSGRLHYTVILGWIR